jgi:hypothetical protein
MKIYVEQKIIFIRIYFYPNLFLSEFIFIRIYFFPKN